MKAMTKSVLALSLLTIGSAQAFELSSKDIQEGHPMAKTLNTTVGDVMVETIHHN